MLIFKIILPHGVLIENLLYIYNVLKLKVCAKKSTFIYLQHNLLSLIFINTINNHDFLIFDISSLQFLSILNIKK